MKITLLLCLYITISNILQAQSIEHITQAGTTYQYNGKKARTPIGKVYIDCAASPNGILSDSTNGRFNLILQGRKLGDKLGNVTIKKKGMIVFNKDAVEEWSVRKDPLTLILCNADEFEKRKRELINIGKKEAKIKYDRQIAEIEKKHEEESIEYYNKIAQIDKEFNEAINKLGKYADLFARIDESEVDTLTQQAIEQFYSGEVDKAIELFEQKNYMKAIRETRNRIKMRDEAIKTFEKDNINDKKKLEKDTKSIETQIAAYKVLNKWEKVAELLKALADEFCTFEWFYKYAEFCHQERLFKDAEIYYNKCIDAHHALRDSTGLTNSNILQVLNNLASLYNVTQEFTKSEKVLHEALNISDKFVKLDSIGFTPIKIDIMSNIAALYSYTNRHAESESYQLSILNIYKDLYDKDPGHYEVKYANANYDLANLYLTYMRKYDESGPLYKKALEIYRSLDSRYPNIFKLALASMINGFAIYKCAVKEFSESEKLHKEALEIRRSFMNKNRHRYIPLVMQSINNLALVYLKTKSYKKSELLYHEALETFRVLAKENFNVYGRDVVMVLINLGQIYHETGEIDKCLQCNTEAFEVLCKLMINNPEEYFNDFIFAMNYICYIYNERKQYNNIKEITTRALETTKKSTKILEDVLSSIEHNLMYLNSDFYSYKDFLKNTEIELIELCDKMTNVKNKELAQLYAILHGNLSNTYLCSGEFDKAEEHARIGIESAPSLTFIHINLAMSQLLQGKYSSAEKLFIKYKCERKTFLNDIENLESLGAIPENRKNDIDRIKRLLNE